MYHPYMCIKQIEDATLYNLTFTVKRKFKANEIPQIPKIHQVRHHQAHLYTQKYLHHNNRI